MSARAAAAVFSISLSLSLSGCTHTIYIHKTRAVVCVENSDTWSAAAAVGGGEDKFGGALSHTRIYKTRHRCRRLCFPIICTANINNLKTQLPAYYIHTRLWRSLTQLPARNPIMRTSVPYSERCACDEWVLSVWNVPSWALCVLVGRGLSWNFRRYPQGGLRQILCVLPIYPFVH